MQDLFKDLFNLGEEEEEEEDENLVLQPQGQTDARRPPSSALTTPKLVGAPSTSAVAGVIRLSSPSPDREVDYGPDAGPQFLLVGGEGEAVEVVGGSSLDGASCCLLQEDNAIPFVNESERRQIRRQMRKVSDELLFSRLGALEALHCLDRSAV